MILRKLIKYKLLEICLETIFNRIIINFTQINTEEVKEGDKYKYLINTIAGYEEYRSVIIGSSTPMYNVKIGDKDNRNSDFRKIWHSRGMSTLDIKSPYIRLIK